MLRRVKIFLRTGCFLRLQVHHTRRLFTILRQPPPHVRRVASLRVGRVSFHGVFGSLRTASASPSTLHRCSADHAGARGSLPRNYESLGAVAAQALPLCYSHRASARSILRTPPFPNRELILYQRRRQCKKHVHVRPVHRSALGRRGVNPLLSPAHLVGTKQILHTHTHKYFLSSVLAVTVGSVPVGRLQWGLGRGCSWAGNAGYSLGRLGAGNRGRDEDKLHISSP
ncbi:hypothetical protein B0H13DRAFT_981643 [Mycena leptocephala]|nr:hypothetical protein B0H13DRAFT_981643 [Mycena leptocephala]